MDGRLVQIGFMSGESTAPRRFPARPGAPPDDHRLDAEAAHRRGEGADCRRAANARSGRCSIAAPSSRSSIASFPLAEAADAHRLMESSEHIGKIVLGR